MMNIFRQEQRPPKFQAPLPSLNQYHIIFKKKYINVTRQRGKEFFKTTKKSILIEVASGGKEGYRMELAILRQPLNFSFSQYSICLQQ
jgi:hypothetical protein